MIVPYTRRVKEGFVFIKEEDATMDIRTLDQLRKGYESRYVEVQRGVGESSTD
jgi:hypothetical protein